MSLEAQNPVDFDDLYRDLILDHYRRPRHKGALETATVVAEGLNPSCGDEIRVELQVEDGKLVEIAFSGMGCSISQASASISGEGMFTTPGTARLLRSVWSIQVTGRSAVSMRATSASRSACGRPATFQK